MSSPLSRLSLARLSLALVPLALAGCAQFGPLPEGALDYERAEVNAARAYAFSYSETPFANGPMSVIATERGGIATWHLVPCRGGTAICADGLYGAAGTVEVTADYHIVRGLHGRTFWLSPGGDGAVQYRDGSFAPLAWDSVEQPIGGWETARMTEGPARD